MRREQSGEPDGFIAEIGAQQRFALVRRVAFVEKKIEHFEDGVEPRPQFCAGRHFEIDALLANLALAANQSLRYGGFLREKCTCNLPRAKTGHGLER
jgi:hypothetical protein